MPYAGNEYYLKNHIYIGKREGIFQPDRKAQTLPRRLKFIIPDRSHFVVSVAEKITFVIFNPFKKIKARILSAMFNDCKFIGSDIIPAEILFDDFFFIIIKEGIINIKNKPVFFRDVNRIP